MKTKFLTLALAALTIGLSASCDIWPRTTPVTGVTLDKTALETSVDDFDVKLTATVVPDYATDKTVIWSSDKLTRKATCLRAIPNTRTICT